MGRLGLERVLQCFSLSISPNSCVCFRTSEGEEDDDMERKALIQSQVDQIVKLKGIANCNKTLAFHLEPKTVVLKVSMHCYGCARKVQKHISKIEGVTSFEVDLESKRVVVVGDITPFEVLESISKRIKGSNMDWLACHVVILTPEDYYGTLVVSDWSRVGFSYGWGVPMHIVSLNDDDNFIATSTYIHPHGFGAFGREVDGALRRAKKHLAAFHGQVRSFNHFYKR